MSSISYGQSGAGSSDSIVGCCPRRDLPAGGPCHYSQFIAILHLERRALKSGTLKEKLTSINKLRRNRRAMIAVCQITQQKRWT